MDEQTSEEEDRVYSEQVNAVISSHSHCRDNTSQCQDDGGFQSDNVPVDRHQQRGSDVSTNGVDSSCEPVPSTCRNFSRSTALDEKSGLLSDQQVDSDLMNGDYSTNRMMTSSSEVMCRVDDQQSSDVIPCQRNSSDCDVMCDQHPSSSSAPPPDENNAQCLDWPFFAARRVDIPLLLDILLARKHRDRTAREFLLNLPASVLKKYEVFSRQNPVFVCLDIVK